MRLVALAVVALAVPSAAMAAPAPPVVKETFTVLPCPAKPKTNLDLEGCAEHQVVASDAKINGLAKDVFNLLSDTGKRGRFVAGERAWLAYRRATCLSRSDVYEGSLSAVIFARCLAGLNKQHVADLAQFKGDLSPH